MKQRTLFKLFVSLSSCMIFFNSYAQQGNIWYFGQFAGIDFSTSPPQALMNGTMITDEGTAAVSDRNGKILFYTDGQIVYNRNYTLMPNGIGLMGNTSSTNSAIIVPKPGDSSHYFIFTADRAENTFSNGYRY